MNVHVKIVMELVIIQMENVVQFYVNHFSQKLNVQLVINAIGVLRIRFVENCANSLYCNKIVKH